MGLKLCLFFSLCFLSVASYAQGASYSFCVKSDEFESFKAVVVFEAVDFGRNSAKLILKQQLKAKLNTEISLFPFFSSSNCGCVNDVCKEIVLNASKIKGVFSVEETGNTSEMPAAAMGTLDRAVTEAKKIMDDPKILLDGAVKQGAKLLDKFFN